MNKDDFYGIYGKSPIIILKKNSKVPRIYTIEYVYNNFYKFRKSLIWSFHGWTKLRNAYRQEYDDNLIITNHNNFKVFSSDNTKILINKYCIKKIKKIKKNDIIIIKKIPDFYIKCDDSKTNFYRKLMYKKIIKYEKFKFSTPSLSSYQFAYIDYFNLCNIINKKKYKTSEFRKYLKNNIYKFMFDEEYGKLRRFKGSKVKYIYNLKTGNGNFLGGIGSAYIKSYK